MNLSDDSDIDRALTGRPIKATEAALKAAKRPAYITEFDEELEPLKRLLYRRFAFVGGVFLLIEAVLIFFVFESTNVRIQSMNGALVFVAAASGFFISLLWMLMPTKRIGYESLKMIRDGQKLAIETAETTLKTMARVNETLDNGDPDVFVARLEKRLDAIAEALGHESKPDYSLMNDGGKR